MEKAGYYQSLPLNLAVIMQVPRLHFNILRIIVWEKSRWIGCKAFLKIFGDWVFITDG